MSIIKITNLIVEYECDIGSKPQLSSIQGDSGRWLTLSTKFDGIRIYRIFSTIIMNSSS